MTDTPERDPTRTEDVEEADVKRSLEAHLTQAKAVSRLRRRADRLEEAARDAGVAMYYEGVESERERSILSRSDAKQLAGDAVAAALDSREDEGEDCNAIYCKCGHPKWAHDVTGIGEDGYKYGICGVCHECIQYRPVHADEPEGDDADNSTADDRTVRVHFVRGDQPLSQEGEEALVEAVHRLCDESDCDCDEDEWCRICLTPPWKDRRPPDEPEGDEDIAICPECDHPMFRHGCTLCGCNISDPFGPFRPAPTDEPEGDEGMTDVQKARCIAYREGFGDGYDYARETDPPTDEHMSGEGDEREALRFARTCAEIALDELDEAKSEVKGVLRNLARLSDRSEGEGETNQIYVKCRPLDSTFDQAPTDESDGDEGAIEKWCSNCGHPVQDHPYIDPDGTVYCDEPLDEPVSREGEAIVDAALNHCAECLSFRPDDYDAGDDLDRVLTRVRHLREEYGDEEAGSGGWATRYQQDVCALLTLLRRSATHADARSEVPEPDADDVRKMSDEELVEGLESLAINFCQKAGFGYMPVKIYALEIKRRLSNRHEDEGERETPMNDRPTFADGEIDRLARIGAAVLERVDEDTGRLPPRRMSEGSPQCPTCGADMSEFHADDCALTRYLEATDE